MEVPLEAVVGFAASFVVTLTALLLVTFG